MIVEIVNTGTELLLGQIVNTNGAYLAGKLNEMGFDVLFHSTVGDNRDRMSQVFATAMKRAKIIITTGGLGPTQGDITKEVSAKLIGRPLCLHQPSLNNIQLFFSRRQLEMPQSNIRQAMVPEGAIVLPNDRGTAPGVIIETGDNTIIHLPGPPAEMQGMFEQSVRPYLLDKFGSQGIILSKVLRTFGLGESSVEEKIQDLILEQKNPTLALLVRNGEVHVRITAKAATQTAAGELIAGLEGKIRARIGDVIFGVDEDTLELVCGRLLTEKKLTVAFAESCTGGLITSRLTDIAGSSDYLTGSVVCYSNGIKNRVVGVDADIIEKYGAVSPETAIAMAQGIRQAFGVDIGVGVTGIAGPGGAVPGKPVGLVYIAIDHKKGVECHQHNFTGQRVFIKLRTANAALNHLRQFLETI